VHVDRIHVDNSSLFEKRDPVTTESTPNPYDGPESDLATTSSGDPKSVPTGHPVAFLYFFCGEFAERCSYYGMRAILPLYLTQALHFSDATGLALYSQFKTACYALPLLGGFLADRFFGKYNTIVWFSIPYVIGHFVLGIESHWAALLALALLAGGSGVIKPNISTLLGATYDQQRPGQTQLRSSAFMWFYFAINVGALISTIALPYLRDNYGYATAFLFPAWLMVASLAVFASGKQFYAKETLVHQVLTPLQKQEQKAVLGRLLGVFALMVLFWVPYEHNDSVWVFFARDHVNLTMPLTNFSFAPDQLQFMNPLCVMIFAPLFGVLFPLIDPQAKIFTMRNKILLGFISGTVASGIMTLAGALAQADTKVSIVWLIASYVLLTIGEVLVYGTGLELAYSAAPANMKGFVTGCFLLTTAIANQFNTFWSPLYNEKLPPVQFFGLSGLFALFGLIGVMLISLPQSDDAPAPETVT